ncbi:hypothetical protein [Terrisporobacter othiniensis]|uniref:hypothetical protein n=1 Tax=Terrisporobacter othiniensis TaxID=1577792 RepID=UPI00292DBFE4|nr:hypothetical protein [Terrisporobacter othiniensis]
MYCDICKGIFDAKKYGMKDRFEVKGADHTDALDKDKEGYIEHLNKFLDSAGMYRIVCWLSFCFVLIC